MGYLEIINRGRMKVFTSDGIKVTFGSEDDSSELRQGNTYPIDESLIGKVEKGYIYGKFKEVGGKLIFFPEV